MFDIDIDDGVLVLASARGDERAFHALYARYHGYVFTLVIKLIGSGPDCEDVLQDVFLQLYRALPNFRGDSSLSTFLRRIAMNVAFDHLRKRCRHQRIDYDAEAVDVAVDAGQDLERRSGARQQLQSLLRDLDAIAPDHRRALLLVAVAGLSLNDAATRMGTNPGWVKQRLVRARRELRARTARRLGSARPPHGDPRSNIDLGLEGRSGRRREDLKNCAPTRERQRLST